MKISFPVALSVVFNPSTSETFIVPDPADVADVTRLARADFEAELIARKDVLNEDTDTQEKQRVAFKRWRRTGGKSAGSVRAWQRAEFHAASHRKRSWVAWQFVGK